MCLFDGLQMMAQKAANLSTAGLTNMPEDDYCEEIAVFARNNDEHNNEAFNNIIISPDVDILRARRCWRRKSTVTQIKK